MHPLPVPARLSVDVTRRCNLSCRHCRHTGRHDSHSELTTRELEDLIEQASRMEVFRLVFSGGEPFLRPDLVHLVRLALEGRVGRVFISTNALEVDWPALQRLTAERERLTFKVSLDGPPSFHDRLCGQAGACRTARESIRELIASGFDVQVTTTVMRGNIGYLPELIQWSARAGCSKHHLVEVIPVGRAGPKMTLDGGQRQAAWRLVHQARLGCPMHVVLRLPFVCGAGGLYCAGGIEDCGVLADGSVVGCRLMGDCVEGNIRERPLAEIWSSKTAFATFRNVKPNDLSSACRACPQVRTCLGGCHAYARRRCGSASAPDPRCPRGRANPATHAMGKIAPNAGLLGSVLGRTRGQFGTLDDMHADGS